MEKLMNEIKEGMRNATLKYQMMNLQLQLEVLAHQEMHRNIR